MPQDFLDALALAPQAARDTYATFDSRNRYAIYHRLTTAKRPETRAKRIADFIAASDAGRAVSLGRGRGETPTLLVDPDLKAVVPRRTDMDIGHARI